MKKIYSWLYLYFSDYCPHLCRHVYHNLSAVACSYLLQVVRMSNLALYFSTSHVLWMSVISYLHLISPLKVLHCLHQLLNSYSIGYVTGANQHLYPLCHVSLRTAVFEFLGIINLMSSATIFTSAHIAILLLSLQVFYQSSYCNFVVIIAFLWHSL